MTTITQEMWTGDGLPGEVPEGCTYQQYLAAYTVVERERTLEDNIHLIKKFQSLHEHTKSEETKSLMELLIGESVEEIRSIG